MYDLHEFLLPVDLEGNGAEEQLVSEDANRPEIYLLVIELSLENLR